MRKVLMYTGLTLMAAMMLAVTGAAVTASQLLDDIDPVVRAAASDVISQQCNNGTVSSAGANSRNGVNPANSPEARRAGLQCQVSRFLNTSGDPFLGGRAAGAAQIQKYATGAVSSSAGLSIERRWARAQAAVLAVRDGFAIVPGGPAEAYNRIQTCLAGALVSNQGNRVQGVSLNCGSETIRRAVADLIAVGFYIQFGGLVGVDCADLLDQANNGATVEARWAGAQAYVAACDPDLADLLANGNAELSFAAVAPSIVGGGTSASGANADLVKAYVLGIAESGSITVDTAGNPKTPKLGNLYKYSLARFGTDAAYASHAPLARSLFGGGELRISVARKVSGATLPLISYVLMD